MRRYWNCCNHCEGLLDEKNMLSSYTATGQGGGDTPPSRFIRVAYLVNTAKQMDNAEKTWNYAFERQNSWF